MNKRRAAAIVSVFIAASIVVAVYSLIILEEYIAAKEAGEGEAAGKRTVVINIIGGEVDVATYGYGFKEDGKLVSPGPEITLKVGDNVIINFFNIGRLPHTFTIAAEKRFDAEPLWGATIGTVTEPIQPTGEGSVSFVPLEPGEYYYLCAVPGHIELGMWGVLKVEPE